MSEPRPDEFMEFVDVLTESAPEGYEPWLFRCEQAGKNPDLSYGSWKAESARLSVPEAVKWMEGGGNVGIAATADGPLVNVDVDDDEETEISDVKETLLVRSRSRTGFHALYFEADESDEIPNIPTDDAGEVRANWQYVVAPGSYVPVDDVDELPDSERDMAGYYTVLEKRPPAEISYEQLPQVFLDYDEVGGEMDVDTEKMPGSGNIEDYSGDEEGGYDDEDRNSESELFDVSARDVVLNEHGSVNIGDRWEAMFHGSETGANMSFSDKGLINCWRHGVAHNGLQALAVLSDYDGGCGDVGTGKRHSNAGSSCLTNEDGGHIWYAWKYAKQNGYIPDDDPVPYSAMLHVARERSICPITDIPNGQEESLPAYAYDGVLESIRGHDNLNPGRKTTDEFGKAESSTNTNAETDGGATTPQTITDSGEAVKAAGDDTGNDDTDTEGAIADWDEIYAGYAGAEKAEERLGPRFEAVNLLSETDHWANVVDNNVLWRYNHDTGIYLNDGEDYCRQRLVDNIHEQYRRSEHGEIVDQLRGRHSIREDELGGDAHHIATSNGVIEVRENNIDLHDHSPDYRFITQLETAYNPEAECERFKDFLKESVNTKAERKKLQEFAGYCLHHWGLPFHKALFLVGPTASGKSTFLDTIRTMLGGQDGGAVSSLTPQQMTAERFGGSELYGTWANIRNDIPASMIENVGQFKEIIAGDPVKAEKKYKDPFMFEPKCKHLFSANQLPDAETDDEAFYRRIILVAFPTTVPRDARDPDLDDKLQAEHEGVLNWALEGLQRLLQQGRFTADRTPGQTQNTWEKWGSSVDRFYSVGIEDDDSSDLPKSDAYQAYIQYCEEEGIPAETQHKFTRKLKVEGVDDDRTYIDGSRQRVFLNVNLSSRGEELLENQRDSSDSGDSEGDTSDGDTRDSGLGDY